MLFWRKWREYQLTLVEQLGWLLSKSYRRELQIDNSCPNFKASKPKDFMRYLFHFLLIGFFFTLSCTSDYTVMMEEEEVTPTFDPTADWMQKLLFDFPEANISLYDICVPRSHDAGTYYLQNCTIGANECNTQTQYQDMTNQLLDGIRNFDVRPFFQNNVYFTHHSQNCGQLGCYGDRVENILSQLKEFLDEHAELVVIELGHFCNMNGDDEAFHTFVSSILGERLFTETVSNDTPFMNRSLQDIIAADENTGKVIMIYGGVSNNNTNRAKGVFSTSYLSRGGSYSNAQVFEDMKEDQFEKYANFNNNGNQIFEISWTLTMDSELAVACAFPCNNPRSIRDMANDANSQLSVSIDELIGIEQIIKGRIPHVISTDFCDEAVTAECIRVSLLNLE